MKKIIPLENRLIVKPSEDNTTSSQLIIPDGAKEKPLTGTVIEVGPGKDGKPMTAKVGDLVFYRKMCGIPLPAEYCGGIEGCLLMVEGLDTLVVIDQD